LCFFPVLPSGAYAQTAGAELTLDEAVKRALDYNLNIKKASLNMAASGYSEKNLWSEIFPAISASAGASFSRRPMFTSDEEEKKFTINTNAGFGLTLGLNAGIPYSIKSIKLAHQANILRYEDACNQLLIQVTKKYYSLAAERNNLLLLEEIQNLALRQYERSEVFFRNGLTGELSLMNSSLALENARYNLSAANTSYENSMAEFNAMLGMSQETRFKLLNEIDIIRVHTDSEALIRQYLPKRPDIVRALQEIERLENAQKQTLLQNRAPTLSLGLNWRSAFDPVIDELSASATVTIPVNSWIPGTSGSQSVRRARDSIEMARMDLAMTEDAAKTQIRLLTALLDNSWNSILIARLGYETAQRSYQLTERGFNSGIVEALALEDARNNMANTRQRLLQSEFAYFNMILELSAAVNADWKYLIQTYGVQDG
jgi:multidrug efflux system outer membrane protein